MQDPESAYRAFQTALRRYLLRRLGNRADVDDVLQDVFVRVTRNRRALAAAKDPRAWLHAVAKTAAIDHRRRQTGQAGFRVDQDVDDIADASTGRDDDGFTACLMPLVDSLPDMYRDAIRFVDIEGGRQTALAAETGMTLTAVKSRVQRGRRRLKAAITACCVIERDARNAISGLDRGTCAPDCC